MAVCGACGAENRDKARFCRGCARPLAPVPAAAAGEPRSPAAVARRRARRAARASGAGRSRWRVVGLVLAFALLAMGWLATRDRVSPAVALPAVEQAQATAAPPEATTSTQPAGAAPVALAPDLTKAQPPATEPERPAAERRAQPERERVARERQRAARSPEPPRPEPVSRPVDPVAPPVVVAEAVAPVAVQAPPPAATVEQICAGSGNFLARDVCRVRACRSPAMAGDPICVRYREMEDANRHRQSQ